MSCHIRRLLILPGLPVYAKMCREQHPLGSCVILGKEVTRFVTFVSSVLRVASSARPQAKSLRIVQTQLFPRTMVWSELVSAGPMSGLQKYIFPPIIILVPVIYVNSSPLAEILFLIKNERERNGIF